MKGKKHKGTPSGRASSAPAPSMEGESSKSHEIFSPCDKSIIWGVPVGFCQGVSSGGVLAIADSGMERTQWESSRRYTAHLSRQCDQALFPASLPGVFRRVQRVAVAQQPLDVLIQMAQRCDFTHELICRVLVVGAGP